MNKRYIPGVIVVEGTHDVGRVSMLYESNFVVTNGYEIPEDEKDFIIHLSNDIQIIILTDNDVAGEKIRSNLNELKKNMINIRIKAPENSKKPGVAECNLEDIKNALDKYSLENNKNEYINLYQLGLSGSFNSKDKIRQLSNVFHLGKCSLKNIQKRIALKGIKEEEIIKEIEHAFSR